MVAVGYTAVWEGLIRAEEHLNGSLCAAEVDLEALSTGEYSDYLFSNHELIKKKTQN